MSSDRLQLLVVDDEPNQRNMLAEYLEGQGHEVRVAADAESGLELLRARGADLVLSDLRLPRMDGIEFLRRARSAGRDAEFLVMTAFGSVENAVAAMRAGAYDYLTKPLRLDELDQVIVRVAEKRRLVIENRRLRKRLQEEDDFAGMGEAMRTVCEMVDRVASSEATVLITGETGTGKELIANRIHNASRRAKGPLLTINCAALPDGLLESELFGYEKGAFTGADGRRIGMFEAAGGGTLLLDEIGDISPGLQVRLLRVIQQREVMRLGSRKAVPVDVRILAATHRDLDALVKREDFRSDLLYRLRVIEIHVPPLRSRPEDIPVLVERLLHRHAARNGVPVRPLSNEAMSLLVRHPFPGNVRELENILERALILARGDRIESDDLPAGLRDTAALEAPARTLTDAIAALEKSWIRRALQESDNVRARAARWLGIPDRVLRYKLKKYGIEPQGKRPS